MLQRMERTADEKRDILRTFINERGVKIAQWAKSAGVGKNSIYNFLNGYSDDLDPRTYAKLARAAEVPSHRLTGDIPEPQSPTSIWVVGQIEAGAFKDAIEWDRSKWYAVDVPVPARFRKKSKALEVRGPSMNMEYPEGSVVVWVDQLDFRPARDGDHVVVYSYAADDGIEATVKELRIAEGREWLWPRSHHPAHQTPIDVANPPENVRRIEIQGIVLGGYRPRVL
jgi:SOS-response transcriptional repressor LexA